MKYILTFFAFVVGWAHSESYSSISEIKAISVGDSGARIKLNSMVLFEGCSSDDWFWLDMAEGKNMATYSGLLAHKMAKEKVFLQLTGYCGPHCRDKLQKFLDIVLIIDPVYPVVDRFKSVGK